MKIYVKNILLSLILVVITLSCCSCGNQTLTPEQEKLAHSNADYAFAMVKIHYSMTGDELTIDNNSIETGILIDPYPEGTTYVEFDSAVKSNKTTTEYHNMIAVRDGKMDWGIAVKGTNKYKTVVNTLN
ncbi:MAG: hypothetical protein IJG16_06155 [Clostridia bacterium]|nr:hypothetical protein [Clostridia bacterium]